MRFSLRFKLTLISLLLLLIPLIGFRFGKIITRDLFESRQETLLFSARAVASALPGRTGLLDQELFHSLNKSRDLYVFQLTNPIRLNGKTDDWMPQLNEAEEFSSEHLLSTPEPKPFSHDSLHFKHLIGVRGDYIYAVFLVTDDVVVYRPPGSLGVGRADHLQIGIEDKNGDLHRYIVSTGRPGWVNGFRMPRDPSKQLPVILEKRIQGVWSETEEGYIVELRVPRDMIGDKFAFAVADVDDETARTVASVIGTANPKDLDKLGWLLSPSRAIEDILQSLGRPQSRILIVDSNQRVRASFGSLASEEEELPTGETHALSTAFFHFMEPVYQLFTTPFSDEFKIPPALPTTLDISGVNEALLGNNSTTRYRIAEEQVEIMAAIAPLREGEKIVGAVVVEQTTNSILALQNQVIEESITFTILAFVLAAFCLLLFASRLSQRIRRLRDQADNAITKTGQIRTTFTPTRTRDEIGDLSRTLAVMLTQHKEQSDYRETMADNLEHEMRTPLAGISASLKNIRNELDDPPERIDRYLEWALTDAGRLEQLLSAIRDATNLQDALLRDTHEDFNLAEAIRVWVEHSWQPAFPGVEFTYSAPPADCMLYGDPGRIRQLLDKLIENAVSFHTDQTPITIILEQTEQATSLTVANQGPNIPEELAGQIFNSMVSRRDNPDARPHLGLGLYIARTITVHHRGTIIAENLVGNIPGVRFILTFPRS